MDKIIEIVKGIISPEQSWSAFVMKIIGLIVVAVIAYVGFQQYSSLTVEEDTEIPIEEVFEKYPEKKIKVEDYKFLSKKTPISGKFIMFTGGFVDKSRSELKSLAEKMGAKIVSNISKKTDFLVTGSQKPTTRKIEEAKNLNIKIL